LARKTDLFNGLFEPGHDASQSRCVATVEATLKRRYATRIFDGALIPALKHRAKLIRR
jgi:hypothetical protein